MKEVKLEDKVEMRMTMTEVELKVKVIMAMTEFSFCNKIMYIHTNHKYLACDVGIITCMFICIPCLDCLPRGASKGTDSGVSALAEHA